MPSNKKLRILLNAHLQGFVDNTANDTRSLVLEDLNNLARDRGAYGKAAEVDFQEYAPLVAYLLAYNNKHYYLYKAISDPTKIGALSARQYFLLTKKIEAWKRHGFAGARLTEYIHNFLRENGSMASPYKLLKRAFKENPYARGIARFFPLLNKKTQNEDKLISICDGFMRSDTFVEFRDATVQECYDLDFTGSDIRDSGTRYAANSCMFGKKVGAFYDAFGAKGKIVYYRGAPIGRFLVWELANGTKYIDRLYVRAGYADDVLQALDKQFPDIEYLKYPSLRETNTAFKISLKNPDALVSNPVTPYIDTFAYLFKDRRTNQYFLTNSTNLNTDDYRYLDTLRSVGSRGRMRCCPHCKKTYWSGDSDGDNFDTATKHRLYCTGYKPRTKELQAYLKIFRDAVPTLRQHFGGVPDDTFILGL